VTTPFQQLILQPPSKVTAVGVGKFNAKKVEWEGTNEAAIFKEKLHEDTTFRGIPRVEIHLREEAAYLLDSFLGFHLVPETRVGRLNGREGSFQRFISNATLSYDLVPGVFDKRLADWKTRVKKFAGMVNQDSLRDLVLLDLIMGNVDRHAKNALFTVGDRKCVAIDNGCSFGRFYTLYRDVFHKYLFMYHFPTVPQALVSKLSRITVDDLHRTFKGFLPPTTVRYVYWRIQFVLAHRKDLSFRTLSQGKYKTDDFPDYKAFFRKYMKRENVPKGQPIVFDPSLLKVDRGVGNPPPVEVKEYAVSVE
jgi:hypothetical protein